MSYRDGKKSMVLTEKKGEVLDTCATISDKYVCCNVKVMKTVSNCPYECSYCFLQNYLTNPSLSAVQDIEGILQEVRRKIEAQPWRIFRIGTWELGDSLALEPQLGQAPQLIEAFRELPNAFLELKTKSDHVESILSLDHQEKTVVSWSLNTEFITQTEENKTASLEKRLTAMQKVAKAGYLVGAHFDPMIYYPNCEKDYQNTVHLLFDAVPSDRIAWLSIGSLRFNPEQQKTMQTLYPGSPLTSAEMVIGDDRKYRYVKPLRVQMYTAITEAIKARIHPLTLFYLCMERWDMWDKILGYHPQGIAHLDYLFAEKIHQRFPHSSSAPDLSLYERYQNS